jgi:hypothetical protein
MTRLVRLALLAALLRCAWALCWCATWVDPEGTLAGQYYLWRGPRRGPRHD